MHFQRSDDFLRNYLSHFSEKSFRLKPFEYTRFHDIPQKGYDQNKIAYFDTYVENDANKLSSADKRVETDENNGILKKLVENSLKTGREKTETEIFTNKKSFGTEGKFLTINKNFELKLTLTIDTSPGTDNIIFKLFSKSVCDLVKDTNCSNGPSGSRERILNIMRVL